MKFPTLLCVITITVNSVLVSAQNPKVQTRCDVVDSVNVTGVLYEKKKLAGGLNRPYQLSYHKQNKDIFFSNNVGGDAEDKFQILRLYHNGTNITIEEVKNGFATAIHEEKQVAYLGGSDGIYKMDLDDGNISKILDKHDIWDMFFKKHLYFITYPSQQLYKLVKESKPAKNSLKVGHEQHDAKPEKWAHEKIYQFAIDGDDDRYITNQTGLYIIKNATEHRIRIQGETVFRAIEINRKGEAHFIGKNGIYIVKKPQLTLHKIAHISNTFGLAFDGEDNIVYSDHTNIINLLPITCKKK